MTHYFRTHLGVPIKHEAELLPEYHWLSPISKIALNEAMVGIPLTDGTVYEPAENYPHEYGAWLIQSGIFVANLIAALDKALAALVSIEYSEREQQTFSNQRLEAERYLADNQAPTPTLDGIMVGGNYVSKEDLANRIKAKADPLGFGSGYLVGLKNKALKELSALDIETVTHADVLALMPDFTLPGEV